MQRAITAIYRTHAVADLVRNEIADLGISRGYIHVVPDRDDAVAAGSYRDDSVMHELHDLDLPQDDVRTYQQAVRRGDYVVSANVDDDHVDRVMEVMRRPEEEAYNIDEVENEYRDAEYVAPLAGTGTGAGMGAAAGVATGAALDEGREAIPVAEERLTVGKREVDRGTTHVRSYVREQPVEERVMLRDEEVHVERRAVGETLTGAEADAAFQERSIDVTEHDEEAVVSKEAVVTEEVVVSKDVETREEVVRDTVRKTEVEVDKDRA